MNCLAENTIVQLVQGTLAASAREAAEQHIDGCPDCLRAVAEAAKYVYQDGSRRVSRYVLREAIGAGAMGIVYAAHDPQLDRKVALKLLRADGGDAASQARLAREAQAMAKLNHPNVVAVYDAGEYEGRVFVTMELVEGRTLAAWLAEAARPWREITDMLVGAGRGLAAAHAAGLVHRDFKPANVLIGGDGRARVTDFGLARRPVHAGASEPARDAGSLLVTMTQTGGLAGTPAYMAPEQLERRPADARSDQFSYCVTFYEALFGVRPFPGETLLVLAEAVTRGELRERPKSREVPDWLYAVLVRGLAVAPDARFPALAALLAEIDRNLARPRQRGMRYAIGAVAACAIAAGLIVAHPWSDAAPVPAAAAPIPAAAPPAPAVAPPPPPPAATVAPASVPARHAPAKKKPKPKPSTDSDAPLDPWETKR